MYLTRPARRWPIAVFVVLAYGISWACWLPIAFAGDAVQPGDGWPTHFPGLLGPLVAAFVVTALTEDRTGVRDLLARMLRRRTGARWWLVAAGSPLALFAIALLIATLVEGRPDIAGLSRVSGLPATLGIAGVWVMLVLVNGLGEETGWRGYALPMLQRRYSPLVATVLVTAIWAAWHAPLFVILESYRGFSVATIPAFFFSLFCGAVVLTWLYNGSGGSVLLAAVWHGTYNLVAATDAARGLVAVVVTAGVIVWAVRLVVRELRARHEGGPSVLDPQRRIILATAGDNEAGGAPTAREPAQGYVVEQTGAGPGGA
jgi:membrane protease YdiL (CAAX protease family)